jgi:cell division septation protein DedD
MAVKNIRSFEFKLGKLGLTLLITGIGVLVFGAFVLGVNVGKDIDTYPEKIVKGIPRMIAEGMAYVFPKAKSDGDGKATDKAALDLTFYDTLTRKGSTTPGMIGQENRDETAVPAVIVAPAPPAVTAAPSPPPAQVTPAIPPAPGTHSPAAAPSVKNAAPKPAVAPPPGALPKAKTGTASAPPVAGPAAAANFSIQVVSYDELAKANQLQKKLQGLGYKAEVSGMEISGKGKWYRVMLNHYQNRQEAEKVADNINKKVKGLNCIVRHGDKS